MRWGGSALLLVALAAFPLVFTNPAVTSIGVFTMIFLIAAAGWNIFSGYSGYISIGHATYYGIGQYTVALMVIHLKVTAGWTTFELLPWPGWWRRCCRCRSGSCCFACGSTRSSS